MITAYDILKTEKFIPDFSESNYDELVQSFQKSFWDGHHFHENLSLHRKPREYKLQVLQDLYNLASKIQGRPELRDIDPIKNTHGYVHVRIQELWQADKRLRSIYRTTEKYCQNSGKDFKTIIVHIAEYRALNLLIKRLYRNIYLPSISATPRIPEKKKPVTKKRKSIPAKLRRELQKEAGSKCPFCGNDDVAIHEAHHIDENPANNFFENLIHVCGNCHAKITLGEISRDDVVLVKQRLLSQKNIDASTKAEMQVHANVANIRTGNHASITIKQTSKKTLQKYPPGCIGYEIEKANYISYLANRYNEYKEWEVGKDKMRHAFIYTHLKHQFKMGNRSIFFLPLSRFEELVKYLQNRIDKTKLSKVKGNNHRNYSTLLEYRAQTVFPNS